MPRDSDRLDWILERYHLITPAGGNVHSPGDDKEAFKQALDHVMAEDATVSKER